MVWWGICRVDKDHDISSGASEFHGRTNANICGNRPYLVVQYVDSGYNVYIHIYI